MISYLFLLLEGGLAGEVILDPTPCRRLGW